MSNIFGFRTMILKAGRARAGWASALGLVFVVSTAAVATAGSLTSIGARPSYAVAVSRGRLIVLDTDTGHQVRALRDTPNTVVESMALSPDGRQAFLAEYRNGVDTFVVRIPVEGGEPEDVAEGRAPAVSPDGRLLAYAVHAGDPRAACPPTALAVRDLVSGAERRWLSVPPGEPECHSYETAFPIIGLSWAPDSRHLALSQENPDATGVAVLDTSTAATLSDAKTLDGAYAAPEWLPNGRLAVIEYRRAEVLAIDVATGATWPLLAGSAGRDVRHVDADSSGNHLLLVRQAGALATARPGGAPERLAEGSYSQAAW